mgnify:CR=1 FL=1
MSNIVKYVKTLTIISLLLYKKRHFLNVECFYRLLIVARFYMNKLNKLTHYLPVVSYDTEQTLKTLTMNLQVHANFLHYSGNLAAQF